MVQVFLTFLRLGCMSFGGPAAHLGYFRDEFVRRRAWLSEEQFAQCIAITQLLPGPGSSQTGMLIGLLRARWAGMVAAWIGFTLPSAILMTLFARYAVPASVRSGWLHGLLVAAVAVVASAILMMRRSLIKRRVHLLFAFATCAAMLLLPYGWTAPAAIALCAIVSLAIPENEPLKAAHLDLPVSRRTAIVAFAIFLALLLGLQLLAQATHTDAPLLAAKLFDVGSLVFGGGHVVLPLLQSQVVSAGISTPSRLITGYAAAQALPGPLFTLSSYIGAVAFGGKLGVAGAAIATVAIFSPSFFLIAAIAPFYGALSHSERFMRALQGANASVVGLLASAFVTPIWTNAIHSVWDGLLAAASFAALAFWRAPSWLIVGACALLGWAVFR